MPQGRIVLKRICQSRKLADLKTDGARLLYTWLIPNVDVNGCFSADPAVIKGQIFTRLNRRLDAIEDYLEDLDNNHLIIRYKANDDNYLCIPDFVEKQPRLDPEREGKPDIPPPTQDLIDTYSRVTRAQIDGNSPLSKVKESKVNVKGFVPPNYEEVKKYISDNPELSNVNPETFFKGFNDSGWIDTQGKPVRNWKLKLRTWSSFGRQNMKPQKSAQQREEENIKAKRRYEQAQTELMKRFEERSGKKIEMKKVEQPMTDSEQAQNKQKILNQLSGKG